MTSLTANTRMKLEYFIENEYRWCPLEIVSSRYGGDEVNANVTKSDELPDVFNGRYLYSIETGV
jgi:hypothetical protein